MSHLPPYSLSHASRGFVIDCYSGGHISTLSLYIPGQSHPKPIFVSMLFDPQNLPLADHRSGLVSWTKHDCLIVCTGIFSNPGHGCHLSVQQLVQVLDIASFVLGVLSNQEQQFVCTDTSFVPLSASRTFG
jgi:hypothetical protein